MAEKQSTKKKNTKAGEGSSAVATPSSRALWRSRWPLGIALVVVMVGAVATTLLLRGSSSQKIDSDGYQAVFLINDQVYFGKLTLTPRGYVLKNPFVIQNAPVDETKKEAATQPSFNLQKVSNTVYGPKESMEINKDQVLFWQNLSSESKVTRAIQSAQ
jgi:hypothetical protein